MGGRIHRGVSLGLILAFVIFLFVGCQPAAVDSDSEKETGQNEAADSTDLDQEDEQANPGEAPDESGDDDVKTGEEAGMENITLPYTAEAEEGTIQGAAVKTTVSGFSGTGYVGQFEKEGDYVEVEIPIPEQGAYEIKIRYLASFGEKTNNVYLNGQLVGAITFPQGNSFEEKSLGQFTLDKGENTVRFQKDAGSWGWMFVDGFVVDKGSGEIGWNYDIKPKLINPNANEETQKLYEYLLSIYGKKTLSAQQLYFADESEIKEIKSVTGKLPAMKGYDMINQTPGGSIDHQVRNAIDWHVNQKGIVTMCWHWWAPTGGRAFYTKDTTFDIRKAVTPGTEEYELVLRDMDIVAGKLKEMQDAGVPVIWRPLHEASGGWFWWGAHGPEPYKKLWQMMYDRFTNDHKLNNLIWVWNGQSPSWFVGDEYYDIAGEDIYVGEGVYSAHHIKFGEVYDIVEGKKPIALTENGPIPDPDLMEQTGARWLWFMPWWGDFINDPKYTDRDMLKKVYNHEDVITLDELPNLEIDG